LTLAGQPLDPPLRPGDPIGLRFEVYTPGESLPGRVEVLATLRGEGDEVLAERELRVDVPTGAIGYVVEEASLELPEGLEPGAYRLRVEVTGDGGNRAEIERTVPVEGSPDPARRLVGRGVVLTSLSTGRPLFGAGEVIRGERIVPALIQELRATADAAEESLPTAQEGRFSGLSGGVLFETSDEVDVRDFLAFLVREGVASTRLTFVDGYAQWALEGAR
jgi:hypothetical protein